MTGPGMSAFFAISSWLTGKAEMGLLNAALHPSRWDPSKAALVVLAIAIGGLASNLLATMISDNGWTETYGRHSTRAVAYTTLIVVCALVTTIVAVR